MSKDGYINERNTPPPFQKVQIEKLNFFISLGVTGLKHKIINISDSLSFIFFVLVFSLKKNYKLFTILDVFTYFNIANQPHLKNLSPLQNLSIFCKRNFGSK